MVFKKAFLAGFVSISLCMANISGTVTDTGGNLPIRGAVVKLEKGRQTATSDTNGRFTLAISSPILSGSGKSLSNGLFARISGHLVNVMTEKRAVVEIAAFDLSGKALSMLRTTMDAGRHSIRLPRRGTGIYLYKVKSGNCEIVLRGYSVDDMSTGRAGNQQGPSSITKAKQGLSEAAINDVISVTKTGYLNYRCVQYNADTTDMQIKMIVVADTVKDIDGNVYQAVKIGDQVWMAENLRVTRYNDGSPITPITSNTIWDSCFYTAGDSCSYPRIPGYCFYENATNADSIKKYGLLYNWFAVDSKKLAPAGWHVPTDSEWTTLEQSMVLNGYNWDGTTDTSQGNKIAKSLAAQTDWLTTSITGTIGCDLTKNNSSGFSALPTGCRTYGGTFHLKSSFGGWWSATDHDPEDAMARGLNNDSDYLDRDDYGNVSGYSIRLVRD